MSCEVCDSKLTAKSNISQVEGSLFLVRGSLGGRGGDVNKIK